MLKGEKLLWWELDKIAVHESEIGGNMEKADAAENMMRFLEAPTPEECRKQWEEENKTKSDTDPAAHFPYPGRSDPYSISLLTEPDYDCGLLNAYGGGDVGWWHDYIRSEIDRCNQYWRKLIEGCDEKG